MVHDIKYFYPLFVLSNMIVNKQRHRQHTQLWFILRGFVSIFGSRYNQLKLASLYTI